MKVSEGSREILAVHVCINSSSTVTYTCTWRIRRFGKDQMLVAKHLILTSGHVSFKTLDSIFYLVAVWLSSSLTHDSRRFGCSTVWAIVTPTYTESSKSWQGYAHRNITVAARCRNAQQIHGLEKTVMRIL